MISNNNQQHNILSTKFFTNESNNTLLEKFKGVFDNNNIYFFDALIGYFRSSGYFKVRPFLENVPKVRILVGINVDKLLSQANKKGLEFLKDVNTTKDEFLNQTIEDISTANYDKETEDGIIQFINDIINKKIEVRAHPDKKIHAKVYIFRPENFNEHSSGSVITGSSNFTDAGLGIGDKHNYEFNVQLKDYLDVYFATQEFEKLWNDGVEILSNDVEKLKTVSHLNPHITPYELYIKLLIEYFGKNIDYDPDSMGDLPHNFKKLSYQVDAVNEGYNMLLTHNGFILADVVGLGKTIIAALIAKKFLIKNGKESTKILVVYPPAIEKNWKNTFKDFKLDKYTKFISNGSLEKILNGHQDYWNKEDYDLIIVDEAHKFRNYKTETFDNLQKICKAPRKIIGSVEGAQKKVILVTATPLNNKPEDILHQISLFQDLRSSTLPVSNLTSFFSPLIEEYRTLKLFDNLDVDKLRNIYNKIRTNIIEPITIRRTRRDIENIKEYKNDIIKQNIIFPKVNPPQKIEYVLDKKLNELFYQTVSYLTDVDKIHYNRYQAIFGLKPEIQIRYFENAEIVAKSLAYIMKTQLVKRLESSFFAFKKSLSNFLIATERMIAMFEKDKVIIAPDTDINKLIDKGLSDKDIEVEIEKLSKNNPRNQIFKSSDFKPDFLPQLKRDYELIKELVDKWNGINYDPKLNIFLDYVDNVFFDKKINLSGKLVVFSESKDTVDYLTNALHSKGRNDVLNISSLNRKEKYNDIVNNFDANISDDKQKNDYNIIITTEVLAEGINLHRSNIVIHYDTPWNSTKLMQRIGRVNRIGTKAENIFNYVFYPSAQGDEQIKLNKTAFIKIQAFHTAFGEDSQIFSTDEILDDIKLFKGHFKEEEDEKLKYLFFLRQLKAENKELFKKAQNLPLKSRCGRNSASISKNYLQGCTIAFIKSKIKNVFYLIDKNSTPKEITPLEAIKIFEAKINEVITPLINEHYNHVQAALNDFRIVEKKNFISQVDPTALGSVAQRSKKFLSDLTKFANTDKVFITKITNVIRLIDYGKYTNLASDIDKVQKQFKNKKINIQECINKINQIYNSYDVDSFEFYKPEKKEFETPILILSESFA